MLLMLHARKDDRTMCSIMLKCLAREYSSSVRENMIIHTLRNKEMVEGHACNK